MKDIDFKHPEQLVPSQRRLVRRKEANESMDGREAGKRERRTV